MVQLALCGYHAPVVQVQHRSAEEYAQQGTRTRGESFKPENITLVSVENCMESAEMVFWLLMAPRVRYVLQYIR